MRIEGIQARTLVVENCVDLYIGPCDVDRIEVRGGRGIKLEGIRMQDPPASDKVFIEVWDSPGFVAAHLDLNGAGLRVWDSGRG